MEVELKLLLDEVGYERVLAAWGPPRRRLEQENHYFDTTEGRWASRGVGIRLRRENGRWVLTIKSEGRAQGDFVRRREYEREIAVPTADRWLTDGAAFAQAVGEAWSGAPDPADGPLVPWALLSNLRLELELPGTRLRLELDRSTYPDGSVVHELEVEAPDGADLATIQARLRGALEGIGVAYRPSRTSKRARLERIPRAGS